MTTASATRVLLVDLRAQYAKIREEIEAGVHRVLQNADFIMGSEVRSFEQEFATYLGVKHVIGVANGTDALLLSLKALAIGPGDDVIVPANTFVATAEAVIHAGAHPVFVDINSETYTIDVEQIEGRITPRTKAIIPVHLYGQPAEMRRILEIAETHRLYVIEDAAQAHGVAYRGRKVGSWGHMACFSFYPSKNLGAYGDAGAVATNDDQIALVVRKLRDHGGTEKYVHDCVGYNSRLDTLQAAVLLVKLKHLDKWNDMRRGNAQIYNELLSEVPGIVLPAALERAGHVYYLYVIRVDRGSRDGLRQYLEEQGIRTGIHYPTPVHLTPALGHLGHRNGEFPVAERCAGKILSLPMYPELERRQIEYVADHIRSYIRSYM